MITKDSKCGYCGNPAIAEREGGGLLCKLCVKVFCDGQDNCDEIVLDRSGDNRTCDICNMVNDCPCSECPDLNILCFNCFKHQRCGRDKFDPNDVEKQAAEKFIHIHEKCKKQCNDENLIKNQFKYKVTGCGIGPTSIIKCMICGKEKNITDYDCW